MKEKHISKALFTKLSGCQLVYFSLTHCIGSIQITKKNVTFFYRLDVGSLKSDCNKMIQCFKKHFEVFNSLYYNLTIL
jgi:hypothetical protein